MVDAKAEGTASAGPRQEAVHKIERRRIGRHEYASGHLLRIVRNPGTTLPWTQSNKSRAGISQAHPVSMEYRCFGRTVSVGIFALIVFQP
jgi:hypothetical protein